MVERKSRKQVRQQRNQVRAVLKASETTLLAALVGKPCTITDQNGEIIFQGVFQTPIWKYSNSKGKYDTRELWTPENWSKFDVLTCTITE